MKFLISFIIIIASVSGNENSKDVDNLSALKEDKNTGEKPKIQLYYECFCPYSRDYYVDVFLPVVLKLKDYLYIETNPYGKAQTIEKNGKYEFTCQHGPLECYGDTLHACAIKVISNITAYVQYNACLLERSQNGQGSDDEAADKCGKKLEVNAEAIKTCAKNEEGAKLLHDYGVETKKVALKHVPHIRINGVQIQKDDYLLKTLCKILNNEPQPCHDSC